MPKGSLSLRLTDAAGDPVPGTVRVEFEPDAPGGQPATATVTGPVERVDISDISCAGGIGTRYKVWIETDHFKPYGFFQLIRENTLATAADSPVRLVVRPGRVKDIVAPAFADLKAPLSAFLDGAEMRIGNPKFRDEDEMLVGRKGEALFDALGPLRKACLLNLFAKANHATAGRCWSLFRRLLVLRQDRFFCEVDPTTAVVLGESRAEFVSAPKALHKPLPGYELLVSFKSRDAHANIQVTVMHDAARDVFAADVDIDEASGLEHGLEVLRNRVKGRTSPFLVRELLLLTGAEPGALDPGYRFAFKM